MDLVVVDPLRPDPERVAEAAARLRAGGLVALPTETVYGLAADATNPQAVAGIYAAKGRPSTNPLIVHVADLEAARALASDWPDTAEALAARFWPGPLTLVLPRAVALADAVTAGLDTVGIRVPSHPVASAILAACGRPLAAPSANLSTALSPTTAAHVALGLEEVEGLIVDGGATPVGIESTVVSLVGRPTLLRPGAVGAEEIEEVVGTLERREGTPRTGDAGLPSPGLLERHYAPNAALRPFDPEDPDVAHEIEAVRGEGRITGALLRSPLPLDVDHTVPMSPDPAGYARTLYASLHGLDLAGAEVVWVERPPDDPAWEAVRDRLRRASSR